MTDSLSPPPVLLAASTGIRPDLQTLEGFGHVVVRAPTADLCVGFARSMKPDAILIDNASLDVPGIELCARLRHDVEVAADIPVLLMLPAAPTPELRVAGIRAGIWDYLCASESVEEVALKIEMHVQAKRNLQAAAVDGFLSQGGTVLTRTGFTQRVREFGALMVRMRGGLSCVVFVLKGGAQDGTEASLIAASARTSDVVGALSRSEIAVVAPATGAEGAREFAHRMGNVLRRATATHPVLANVTVLAGCASIDNLKYSPVNPIQLLNESVHAVTEGVPDTEHPWIRRFAGLHIDAAVSPSRSDGEPEPSLPSGARAGNLGRRRGPKT